MLKTGLIDFFEEYEEYFNQFMKIARKTDINTLAKCNVMNETIKYITKKIESNRFTINKKNIQIINAIIDYANLLKEKDPYAESRFSFISNLDQFNLIPILDKRNKKNV